jgi:hypothetical protein
MLEVTLMDLGMEVGTIDIPASELFVGNVYDGMRIESLELNPASGEDAIAVITYVF